MKRIFALLLIGSLSAFALFSASSKKPAGMFIQRSAQIEALKAQQREVELQARLEIARIQGMIDLLNQVDQDSLQIKTP